MTDLKLKMTTIEKNKVIAKFMNAFCGHPITDELASKLYNDWNSLVGVLKVIKGKYDNKELPYGSQAYKYYQETVFLILPNLNLEELHESIFEFIQWYNMAKK